MTELSLTESRDPTPLTPLSPVPAAPQERKSPGMAFLLSLLLPGLGQFYCGKNRRGVVTLAFFLIGAALAFFLFNTPGAEILLGIGLRVALVLYLFSFLDAYFTAREINEGLDSLQTYNPRVAAVLNLLTRGFGYWYVDEKKKGIVLFFLVGAADRAALKMEDPMGTIVSLVVEIVMAVMAADAYRIAQEENARLIGAAPVRPEAIEPEGGLKPAIPLALASLFVAAYLGLILLGIVMPDYEKLDHSAAAFADVPDGKVFKNPKYGVELSIPADWEFDRSDPSSFAEAQGYEGACSVSLLPDSVLPFVGLDSIAQGLGETLVNQNPGLRVVENRVSELAGQPAREVVVMIDVEGTEVRQNYVMVKSGLSIYALVITVAAPFAETCQPQFDDIRSRVVIPH